MQQKSRKLLGTVAILALLVVYPLLVMQVYVSTPLMDLPWWGAIVVLCLAGLLWFFPASWVVRWMSKPDATDPSA